MRLNEPEASQDMAPPAAPHCPMKKQPESKDEAPAMKIHPMPMCVALAQVHWALTVLTRVQDVVANPRQLIPRGLARASLKTPPGVPWLPSYKKRSRQQQLWARCHFEWQDERCHMCGQREMNTHHTAVLVVAFGA